MSDNNNSTNNKKTHIDVDRIARLARLDLTDEQREYYLGDLTTMADYTYPLVKSEDMPKMSNKGAPEQSFREDIPVISCEEDCARILANAPSRYEGYITVPKIIAKGGEEQ